MPFYDQFNDSINLATSFTAAPNRDFGVFAKGYTLAANRLAGLLLEAPWFRDYEAYPVVFLYRHALELSLKHIIYSSVKLAACRYLDDVDQGLQKSHDLRRLARIVEDLLALLFPDDERLRQAVLIVTESCHEFSDIDPRSEGYRYPIDSKGQCSPQRQQAVNLRAVTDRMSSVLEDLDTIHFGMNIETGAAQEVYEAVASLLFSDVKDEEE